MMDFSHYIMHNLQHIICEQDILTMMNQMFLFLTTRQLWRSIHGRYSTFFFSLTVFAVNGVDKMQR